MQHVGSFSHIICNFSDNQLELSDDRAFLVSVTASYSEDPLIFLKLEFCLCLLEKMQKSRVKLSKSSDLLAFFSIDLNTS